MTSPTDLIDEIWRVTLPSDALGPHAILPDTRCGIAIVVLPNGVTSPIFPSLPHDRVRFAPIIPDAHVAGVYFKPGRAPLANFEASGDPRASEPWRAVAQALSTYAQDPAQRPALTSALVQLGRWLPEPDPLIVSALPRLGARGLAGVADLASELGLSERQFRRRFLAATGLSPRTFVVTSRLHLSLVELSRSPAPQLAGAASDAGYADQSHWGRSVQRAFDRSLLQAHRDLRTHRARFEGRHVSERF